MAYYTGLAQKGCLGFSIAFYEEMDKLFGQPTVINLLKFNPCGILTLGMQCGGVRGTLWVLTGAGWEVCGFRSGLGMVLSRGLIRCLRQALCFLPEASPSIHGVTVQGFWGARLQSQGALLFLYDCPWTLASFPIISDCYFLTHPFIMDYYLLAHPP